MAELQAASAVSASIEQHTNNRLMAGQCTRNATVDTVRLGTNARSATQERDKTDAKERREDTIRQWTSMRHLFCSSLFDFASALSVLSGVRSTKPGYNRFSGGGDRWVSGRQEVLITGMLSNRSIAYGIAKAMAGRREPCVSRIRRWRK
jgi:hypothetical protein